MISTVDSETGSLYERGKREGSSRGVCLPTGDVSETSWCRRQDQGVRMGAARLSSLLHKRTSGAEMYQEWAVLVQVQRPCNIILLIQGFKLQRLCDIVPLVQGSRYWESILITTASEPPAAAVITKFVPRVRTSKHTVLWHLFLVIAKLKILLASKVFRSL